MYGVICSPEKTKAHCELVRSNRECLSCEMNAAINCQNQFFRIKPSDREAVEGEDIEFQCHVANRGGDVQWSKDGFLLGFDPNIPGYPRYSMVVKEAEGIYNLRIQNVNVQDEGEYQCQVGPALDHSPIRAGAFLRILIPPEFISVNGMSETSVVEVKVNSAVKLTCKTVGSKPPALLTWYRNNVEVPKESVHTEEKEEKWRFVTTSYFSIRPKVEDDGMRFSCEATHKALERKMKVELMLSVLHPPSQPTIEGYKNGTVVRAGDVLTLTCWTMGGNPPPDLIWYRGNAQIDATYFRTDGGQGTANNLTFTVSSSDNGGFYHCKASNAATRDPPTASIKLSVYYLARQIWISGPMEAPRGETITLYCITDVSNPKSKISWVVDGRMIEGGEETSRATTGGWITTSNLTITLTRQEPDTKEFSCEATSSEVDGKISTNHKIKVIYPPNTPTILGYEEGSPLRVGDIQRFTCVSLGGNPSATLRWFKGEREISAPVITTGSGVSSELVIRVQLNDNGAFYRCEANNSALRKPLSAFVRLTVYFPPAFVNISVFPVEPREGDNVTLTCTSDSSNPLSRISWKKEGHYIRDHREETLSSVYGGIATRSRFTFPSVTSSDDGLLITCQAKSDDVRFPVTKTITLRVRHKPAFPTTLKKVEIEERQATTVNLTAKAYPSLVAYTWSKGGFVIAGDGTTQRISARGPLLHVRNVSRDDTGNYHCHAENEEGSANATVFLNVLYPAKVINMTYPPTLLEGEDASLECVAAANPMTPDMIKWRLRGTAFQESQRSVDDGRRSLVRMVNVSKDNQGSIECIADNGIGEPSVLVGFIEVLYRPLVLHNFGTPKVSSSVNGTARMRCVFDGTPNVTIAWIFKGSLLKIDGYKFVAVSKHEEGETSRWTSVLHVNDIVDEDFGTYTCKAQNRLGENYMRVLLAEERDHQDSLTTAVSVREVPGRTHGQRTWWVPAAASGVVIILLGCVLILCCLRKRSNRTTPEGSRHTRQVDISDLTPDEVCSKLLLSADVKSILLCAPEKQPIPMHDFKDHTVFTIEEAFKVDHGRTRQLSKDTKEQETKIVEDVTALKETFIEEIHHSLDKTKDDCPDILRNEKCLCLSTSKDNVEQGSSPRSLSPDSPRYTSTPSGSTGSCLSVYHEKTSIRSLGGDIDNAALMKLHPIMVLRINEDSYKFSET